MILAGNASGRFGALADGVTATEPQKRASYLHIQRRLSLRVGNSIAPAGQPTAGSVKAILSISELHRNGGTAPTVIRPPNGHRLSSEPPFRLAAAGAACCLPRLTSLPAGAACKQHDAAPLLFGRAASAAGAARRLVCCWQKLVSGQRLCFVILPQNGRSCGIDAVGRWLVQPSLAESCLRMTRLSSPLPMTGLTTAPPEQPSVRWTVCLPRARPLNATRATVRFAREPLAMTPAGTVSFGCALLTMRVSLAL
jgi:hypothetical protein